MTLDEAIKNAEEIAEEKEKHINETFATFGEDRFLFKEEENECKKCADEHRQLAEWLKDYKRLLEQEPILDEIRDEIEARRKEASDKSSENDELQDYYFGLNDGLKDTRDIIDEHKAEMKVEE